MFFMFLVNISDMIFKDTKRNLIYSSISVMQRRNKKSTKMPKYYNKGGIYLKEHIFFR